MEFKSLREWLSILEKEGMLKTVSRPVSSVHELAAVAKKGDGKYCVRFSNVSGASMQVVAGIASSRQMFALSLRTSVEDLVERFSSAHSNSNDCILVLCYSNSFPVGTGSC